MTMRMRQVHLDFHTCEHILDVARDFDPDRFAEMLHEAGVNSVTCFSKCHHGLIYHETRFPARHPHLRRDLLREQIEGCRRFDIRVPIYISLGIDEFMARMHPEWIEIDKDGRRVGAGPLEADWRKLCFNTPYLDYVAEQASEVLERFDPVDGLFFDIVWQRECCCRHCLEGMLQAGLNPEEPADRKAFADRVLQHAVHRLATSVRNRKPACRLIFNSGHVGPSLRPLQGAYTHLELDSLPGGTCGYEHLPLGALYGRNLGLDFIGHTGRFHKGWADFGTLRNLAALEYECFRALALGGGCSIGDQLHPSGKMLPAVYEHIGRVYQNVAAKESWCTAVRPITQMGIINPLLMAGKNSTDPEDVSRGVYRMLRERQHLFDFVDFQMDLSRYALIVLPDVIRLSPSQAAVINDYRTRGGKLLMTGTSGLMETGFEFALADMPLNVTGESCFVPDYLVLRDAFRHDLADMEYVMYERGLRLEPLPGGVCLADVWQPYFQRTYRHFCSHAQTPPEKPGGYPGLVAGDRVVYVGYPIFGMYKRHGVRMYRELVMQALRLMLPDEEKMIITDAPTTVEMTLNYQPAEDRYILHVLHYIPQRRSDGADSIEDVIPLHNLGLGLNLPPEYKTVLQVPESIPLPANRKGKRLEFVIPCVDGHAMIAITKSTG